jgi:hypothetical protein
MIRAAPVAVCVTALLAGCCGGKSKATADGSNPSALNAAPATAPADNTPEMAMPNQLKADGWELVPEATYTASQTPGDVIIRATGKAPTAGYEVKLVQSMLRIWPPQYMLYWKKPDGMAAQVITPFDVTATFKSSDVVMTVVVTDGQGRHEVKVDQARD